MTRVEMQMRWKSGLELLIPCFAVLVGLVMMLITSCDNCFCSGFPSCDVGRVWKKMNGTRERVRDRRLFVYHYYMCTYHVT